MGVSLDHQPLGFRTDLIAAELPPRDKELLVRCQPIDRGSRRLSLLGILKRQVGDLYACQITNRFANHQLPVMVDCRLDVVPIELLHHATGLRLKLLKILGHPPVAQAALRIELCTLIVETVAHFVTDDDANRAVVHRVGGIHIERRRLQGYLSERRFRSTTGCNMRQKSGESYPSVHGLRACQLLTMHRRPGISLPPQHPRSTSHAKSKRYCSPSICPDIPPSRCSLAVEKNSSQSNSGASCFIPAKVILWSIACGSRRATLSNDSLASA